jgi:hypothetical protein
MYDNALSIAFASAVKINALSGNIVPSISFNYTFKEYKINQ